MNGAFAVRRIVGELHVSVSDEEAVLAVLRKLRKGAWSKMPNDKRALVAHLAIEAHHANMKLYRSVMGGF